MRTKRRRTLIFVPVASMGDIAFLLIIFFMVCSRFAKEAGVKIDPPISIDVDKLDDYPMVVAIDGSGNIYFQGWKVSDAKELEAEVSAFVEGKTTDRAKTVIFRCDRTVGKKTFEPVIEAIAKGGGRIAAVGKKTKPK